MGSIVVPESELAARPAPPPPTRPQPVKVAEVKAEASAKPAAKPATKPPVKVPPKPDPAKTDPARWWVQLAQGASAPDLARDWRRISSKAPAAFKGRAGWTADFKATNRLLAGPFKTRGEAQAFVTTLAKDDVSTFAWQSEAGQKIEKLAAK